MRYVPHFLFRGVKKKKTLPRLVPRPQFAQCYEAFFLLLQKAIFTYFALQLIKLCALKSAVLSVRGVNRNDGRCYVNFLPSCQAASIAYFA